MGMVSEGNLLLHIKSDNDTFKKLNKIILKITEIIRFYKIPFIAIVARIGFIVSITLLGQLLFLWIDLIKVWKKILEALINRYHAFSKS